MDYPLDLSAFFKGNFDEWCELNTNNRLSLCSHNEKESKKLLLFLKNHNISYLFFENEELLPNYLNTKIELVARDIKTNQTFYKVLPF
jgi:hypothetical protein